ncbi:hypothetical protein EQG49_08970 [Periweissella cryptocerci]|uniref:Sulfatase N-terminal domain-containing protein n=1 Tax=Periweissella cryptocerci TaxID=2506420 RepID=A0A4V1AIT2_9LACO|nr:sulfatase-like hydrolase/transferase [Periweissella cryptocerci]QBO36595.1 hypothetical protein EQG49_08970 [Periweissella cryptocerci]
MEKSEKSPLGLQLLAVIATLGIIINGLMSQSGIINHLNTKILSHQFIAGWGIYGVTLLGFNIVALIAGYLLVNKTFKVSAAIRLWLIVLLYSIGSAILYWAKDSQFRTLLALARTLAPIGHNVYWLATAAVVIVLLAPIFNKVLTSLSPKQLDAFALVLFLFTSVESTFFKEGIFNLGMGQNFIWMTVVYLFGAYFKLANVANRIKVWPLLMGLLTAGFTAAFLILASIQKSTQDINIYGRFIHLQSLPIFIASVAVFLLFAKWQSRKPLPFIGMLTSILVDIYIISKTPFIVVNYLQPHMVKLGHLHSTKAIIVYFVGLAVLLFVSGLVIGLLRWSLFQVTRLDKAIDKLTSDRLVDWLERVKKYALAHKVQIEQFVFMLLTFSVLIIVLDMSQVDWSVKEAFFNMFLRASIFWTNMLILVIFMAIFMAIFNRYWVSLMVISIVMVGFSVGSFEKLIARQEPVLPADISELGSFSELAGMVSKNLLIGAVIGLVILIVITVALQWRSRIKKSFGWRMRLVLLVIGALGVSSFYTLNHETSLAHKYMTSIKFNPRFYDQTKGAYRSGPLLTFVNNLDVQVMAKPKGYNQATVDKLVAKYRNVATEINKTRKYDDMDKQTVIYVLSESLQDPTHNPGVKMSGQPLPYLQQLKKETTSGMMLSSGYGGGTANIEYQVFTSMALNNFSPTVSTPYVQVVPKMKEVPSMMSLFNYKVDVHPYVATLYNRINVFKDFGFNKFFYRGSKYPLTYQKRIGKSIRVSDDSAFKEVELRLNEHKEGQMIGLETMQNHTPYPNVYPQNQFTVTSNDWNMSDAEKQSIANYTEGAHYTDQALKKFIKKLDSYNRPITMLFYGDHLPGVWNAIPMDKYGLQLHETDWFIYSNKYSRTHNAKLKNTKIVSPNDFSALVLDHMNQKVSPFYALMTEVATKLPAMSIDSGRRANGTNDNGNSELVSPDNKLIDPNNLSIKQKQIYADYKMIQYDITAGKQYSLHDGDFIK